MSIKDVVKQVQEVIDLINKNKEGRDSTAASYKEVPLLKKLDEIIVNNADQSEDYLVLAFEAYKYLAEQYTSMGRFAITPKYYLLALKVALKRLEIFTEKQKGAKDIFYNLLKYRNFYVDDDCLDVLKLVKGSKLLSEEEIDQVYENRMKSRRNLKNDPVEMSEEYLAVIDEVEERIDKNKTTKGGMGSCFEIWELKRQYLADKGIDWSSPSLLNPRVMFD